MASTLELALLAAAVILNGLLAGASLDKAITQLPARRKIGLRAMAEYHRATDLGPGLFLYPTLGLGALLLTWAAAVVLFEGRDVSAGAVLWIAMGAVLCQSAMSSRPQWRPRTSFAYERGFSRRRSSVSCINDSRNGRGRGPSSRYRPSSSWSLPRFRPFESPSNPLGETAHINPSGPSFSGRYVSVT